MNINTKFNIDDKVYTKIKRLNINLKYILLILNRRN